MVELKYSGLQEIEQVSMVFVILKTEKTVSFLGIALELVEFDLEFARTHLKN